MAVPSNPAGRLYEFVSRARAASQSQVATAGWAGVFGVQADDLAGILYHSSRLIEMAKDTKQQITALDETTAPVYLKHFSEVDQMLNNFQQLAVTMEQFLAPIKPTSGDYCLEVCSTILSSRTDENVLSDDQTEELQSQLLDLIEAVKATDDLTDDFREWLLVRLAEIADRLDVRRLYRLFSGHGGHLRLLSESRFWLGPQSRVEPSAIKSILFPSLPGGLRTIPSRCPTPPTRLR